MKAACPSAGPLDPPSPRPAGSRRRRAAVRLGLSPSPPSQCSPELDYDKFRPPRRAAGPNQPHHDSDAGPVAVPSKVPTGSHGVTGTSHPRRPQASGLPSRVTVTVTVTVSLPGLAHCQRRWPELRVRRATRPAPGLRPGAGPSWPQRPPGRGPARCQWGKQPLVRVTVAPADRDSDTSVRLRVARRR